MRQRGRLIDVGVQRDHQLERLEGRAQPTRVGRREERVPGDREQGADAALALGLDLVGEGRDRELAEGLREAADAGAPAADPDAAAAPGLAVGVRLARGGEREHDAAGAVEVAGDRVEDVDEPARERAELLRGGADPRVDCGALGGGQLARHAADLTRLDPACRRGRIRLER